MNETETAGELLAQVIQAVGGDVEVQVKVIAKGSEYTAAHMGQSYYATNPPNQAYCNSVLSGLLQRLLLEVMKGSGLCDIATKGVAEAPTKATKEQLALLEDLAITPHNGLPVHSHNPQTFRECVDKGWLRTEQDDSELGNLWIVHPMIVTRYYLTVEGRKVLNEWRAKK